VSTPNLPNGLFDRMLNEEPSIYHKLKLDYTYGIDKVYSQKHIEEAMASPSWEREYCLRFGGMQGDVFSDRMIDKAIERGKTYDPIKDYNPFSIVSIGVDSGFGSSQSAIVATQLVNTPEYGDQVQVLLAEQYEKIDFMDLISRILEVMRMYNVTNVNSAGRVLVDGSNTAVIRNLKVSLSKSSNENVDYERIFTECKRLKWNPMKQMVIVPVNFSTEHKSMLYNLKAILESEQLAINPIFNDLIIAMRSAKDLGEMRLDKTRSANNDLLDSCRLSTWFYRQERM
jgi:hypothetical protein